jgi:hypothetical protein
MSSATPPIARMSRVRSVIFRGRRCTVRVQGRIVRRIRSSSCFVWSSSRSRSASCCSACSARRRAWSRSLLIRPIRAGTDSRVSVGNAAARLRSGPSRLGLRNALLCRAQFHCEQVVRFGDGYHPCLDLLHVQQTAGHVGRCPQPPICIAVVQFGGDQHQQRMLSDRSRRILVIPAARANPGPAGTAGPPRPQCPFLQLDPGIRTIATEDCGTAGASKRTQHEQQHRTSHGSLPFQQ